MMKNQKTYKFEFSRIDYRHDVSIAANKTN